MSEEGKRIRKALLGLGYELLSPGESVIYSGSWHLGQITSSKRGVGVKIFFNREKAKISLEYYQVWLRFISSLLTLGIKLLNGRFQYIPSNLSSELRRVNKEVALLKDVKLKQEACDMCEHYVREAHYNCSSPQKKTVCDECGAKWEKIHDAWILMEKKNKTITGSPGIHYFL